MIKEIETFIEYLLHMVVKDVDCISAKQRKHAYEIVEKHCTLIKSKCKDYLYDIDFTVFVDALFNINDCFYNKQFIDGDMIGAIEIAETVIRKHPNAEQYWKNYAKHCNNIFGQEYDGKNYINLSYFYETNLVEIMLQNN